MQNVQKKITTFLTFTDRAGEAAELYTSIFPDSKVTGETRYSAAMPDQEGTLMTVTFELAGQEFVALNGGGSFTFSQGFSLMVDCEDQAEVDKYWEALTADGGQPGPCGWLEDRFGVSWQIVPRRLTELVSDSDPEVARRAMEAMLQMSKIEIAELERAVEGVATA
jgi:predicted 3-demethylubiquinone-9 3-methyltransferase (glyoxalase superfamily)